jgi:hypothetical protein
MKVGGAFRELDQSFKYLCEGGRFLLNWSTDTSCSNLPAPDSLAAVLIRVRQEKFEDKGTRKRFHRFHD